MMSKLIKITHLTSVHARYDTRIFLKQCTSLAKLQNYKVNLVVADGLGNESKNKIQIYDIGSSTGRFKRIFMTTKKIYKKALDLNSDIYHIHDPELIHIGFKLKKNGKKVIFDSHEDVGEDILIKMWIPFLLRKLISLVYSFFEKYYCKKLDIVITATPHIREKFVIRGLNAIDINNFPILSELTLGKNHWNEKKQEVCYIGAISKERGILEIVNAIGNIEGVKLNLGGSFSEKELEKSCKKLDGWNNINELGYLNQNEISNVLKKSKAGLVVLYPTSTYKPSLPVKMFEYMASGIPIICSNFQLWNDMIITVYKCGIAVNPKDPKEIMDAINYIINHPEESKEMGERGRKAVIEKYNWDNEEKKLYSIYSNL